MISIILYEDRYKADFKNLNLEWLDKYNLTELADLMVLDDPRKTILDRGGIIFLAVAGEEVVGTAALIKEGEGVYELAKMTVATPWQGKGISRLLLDQCLETARLWKATKVTLFSNSQLKTALQLYEKYGFHYVKLENSPFTTADIKMELVM